MGENLIRLAKKCSIISHAAHLFDVSDVLDNQRVEYFAAANCPEALDRDRVVETAIFIYKHRELFDAAITDAVELNISNYKFDILAAVCDKAFEAYAAHECTDKIILRTQRVLARYFADKLPIWYCWYLIRSELLYASDNPEPFVPGMSNSQIEAAIHRRLNNLKGEDNMNSDKRVGEAIVRVNRLEKEVDTIKSSLESMTGVLGQIVSELKTFTAAQAKATPEAVFVPKASPVIEAVIEASPAPVIEAAPEAEPVIDLKMREPLSRLERENQEYQGVIDQILRHRKTQSGLNWLGIMTDICAAKEVNKGLKLDKFGTMLRAAIVKQFNCSRDTAIQIWLAVEKYHGYAKFSEAVDKLRDAGVIAKIEQSLNAVLLKAAKLDVKTAMAFEAEAMAALAA